MTIAFRSAALAVTLAAVAALSLQAQTVQPDQVPAQQQGSEHGRGHYRADPARETKMLAKRLALTPEQAAQVEPILADRAQRLDALKAAAGAQLDFQVMRSQRRAIMEDTRVKLGAVLTDTQKQELEQMHRGHGRRGQQPQSATPASTL